VSGCSRDQFEEERAKGKPRKKKHFVQENLKEKTGNAKL
jgi:hypothetical protein